MSDVAYWKHRCQAAESALKRARSRIWISPARRRVLDMLAELHVGQSATTSAVAERLGLSSAGALASLRKLHGAGLVDRDTDRGCHHRPVQWRLGYLVNVAELESIYE
jgi:predicted transcriptional regulator